MNDVLKKTSLVSPPSRVEKYLDPWKFKTPNKKNLLI